MLEQLIQARAEALNKMKAFNEAHPQMDDAKLSEYKALVADFEKANRDVEVAKAEAMLTSQTDELLEVGSQVQMSQAAAQYTQAFDNYLAGRNLADAMAAMTEGVDADGGYIVPVEYQNTVLAKLNAIGVTRGISNVITTKTTTNIPTEGDAPAFSWIQEGGAYGETNPTLGNVSIGAYKLGGIIKVSEELLKDTSINFDAYMANQIARGIDKAEAPAFAVGDGVNKPTGYATAATVGANSTTAATNAVTADEIIDIFFDLKEEYRKNATWRMNDNTLKAISKLKDGNGNYLLGTLADGVTYVLKGRPVVVDNSMPDMATGAKFIVIGDFNYYQIADRGDLSIKRLNERYADVGMIGFQVSKRVDAKITIAEAFNAGKNA